MFRKKIGIITGLLLLLGSLVSEIATAQVSSVTFGKNRIQYRKYNWRFYQTPNFNVHFNDGGLELAKYVLEVAEEELLQLEKFTETALQRRANIVLYNSYDDAQATNIGLGTNAPDAGGLTQLVNNKMILYFNGNHADLKRQIREGIARILVDTRLFGENIGEIAGNATLLDLPKWMTDGYVSYAAEPWSIAKDDQMKNLLLANEYRNFYQLAYNYPALAGNAFFHYLATNYKKESVTYFMYLSILYKNTNTASLRITKMRLKDLLSQFMQAESDKYYKEIRGRRNYPKGSIAITEAVDANKDFYHFAPNPNPRSYTYAVAEYKKGKYSVNLYENYVNRKKLISNGIRVMLHERNPLYPVMAWDGKGSRLSVIYWEKDKVKLMVYDLTQADVVIRKDLPFDQVQDAQYFLDHKRLILSAVKNGHTDIYLYYVETGKVEQITNDVWDDVDASFVSFPNKYGIIFSSNRPGPSVVGGDTSHPSDYPYNVFLIDVDEKGGYRQVTQLTDQKYGNARYPTQYNMNHFTFVSDENGIGNRYAGFFTTKAEGLDTLVIIGDEILRNPSLKEVDSTLKAWERDEPDSIGLIAVTKDSTYTFPITNYQSSLLESRIAGDKGQVSEVTQQSGLKMLYRLRVDSLSLRRRNVSAKPTEFIRQQVAEARKATGEATTYGANNADTTDNFSFMGEFAGKTDTARLRSSYLRPRGPQKTDQRADILKNAKLYKYRLRFSSDQVLGGITNNLLLTRYQPYAGGNGPIYMNNGNNLSWAFMATISDVLEDYRISGGFKPGINFSDNEYFVDFQNYRKRLDWGVNFYHAANGDLQFYTETPDAFFSTKVFTNRYQVNVSYPLDRVRSVRLITSFRNDRVVMRPSQYSTGSGIPDPYGLQRPDSNLRFMNFHVEYVHDNSLNKTQNIWHGVRWKVYMENIMQLNKSQIVAGKEAQRQFTFNFGADFRYYLPIYRNFIWAVRGATDISWGNQKLIYYLGGVDNWISPKFNAENRPDPSQKYVYQSLALQMRGYQQNLANGNNNMVFNSELRLPLFATFLNKPINNAFIRNFQLVQFIDLGTAWVGTFSGIARPGVRYASSDPNNPVVVNVKAGGVGPFAGGYGFGARSTLLGYFLKVDAGWPMNGFFNNKPQWYFALGFDF